MRSTFDSRHSTSAAKRSAFTLIELLVVIGIIALLLSITFPVIGKIQQAARETDTRALISSLESACQAYHADFNAYPGPLPNSYITALDQKGYGIAPAGWRGDTGIGERTYDASGMATADANGFNDGTVNASGIVQANGERVTQAENVLLGLLGGVTVNKTQPNNFYLEFDATLVGNGPVNLNPVRGGKSTSYMQKGNLTSEGKFREGDNPAPSDIALVPSKDSRIPEFIDRWPEGMPILMMRARAGGKATVAAIANDNNNVVVNVPFDSNNPSGPSVNGQYNLVEITPYTQSSIGQGRKVKQSDYSAPGFNANSPHGLQGVDINKGVDKSAAGYFFPYDAFGYIADPSTNDPTITTAATRLRKIKARKVDGIILISAGRDRVYGTSDDLTNFGSVLP